MTGGQDHWDAVYAARDDGELTWFERAPAVSCDLVMPHLRPGAGLVDVGGGTSRLVDRLLQAGLGPVTVLDISAAALEASRARLGARAAEVDWVASDLRDWVPQRRHAVWHDRAVFHFLTERADRAAYLRVLDAALAADGIAVIGTFAADGPERCSGLPVMRYAPADLAREFEAIRPGLLRPVDARHHMHVTPKGNRQSFQFSVFRKAGMAA